MRRWREISGTQYLKFSFPHTSSGKENLDTGIETHLMAFKLSTFVLAVCALPNASGSMPAPVALSAPAAPPLALPDCCRPELKLLRFPRALLAVDHEAGDSVLHLAVGECGTGFDRCAGYLTLDGVTVNVCDQIVTLSGSPMEPSQVAGEDDGLYAQHVSITPALTSECGQHAIVAAARPSGQRVITCQVHRRLSKREGRLADARFSLSTTALVVDSACQLLGAAGGVPTFIDVDGVQVASAKVPSGGITKDAITSLTGERATLTEVEVRSVDGLRTIMVTKAIELTILEPGAVESNIRHVRVQRIDDTSKRMYARVDVAEGDERSCDYDEEEPYLCLHNPEDHGRLLGSSAVELDTVLRFTASLSAPALASIDAAAANAELPRVQLRQVTIVFDGGVPEMVAAVHEAERLLEVREASRASPRRRYLRRAYTPSL